MTPAIRATRRAARPAGAPGFLEGVVAALPQWEVVREPASRLWSQLRWPLECNVAVSDTGDFVLAFEMPGTGESVLPCLRDHLGFRLGERVGAGRSLGFAQVPFPRDATRVYEHLGHDRHQLLVLSGDLDDQEWIRSFVGRSPELTGREQRLWDAVSRGDARMLLSVPALLQALPAAGRRQIQGPMAAFLGSTWTGFAESASLEGERMEVEGVSDRRTTRGLVGGLFRGNLRDSSVRGWIPEQSREFVLIGLDLRSVVQTLRALSAFGVSMNPSDWGEGDWLDDGDSADFVAEHWGGHLAFIAAQSTPEAALDPDAEEPMVFMFGTPDSEALLDRIGNGS